ncbi:glycosyltransferase family 92 protein RCOM_0530710-like [Aristolochia californica]|uniref:glycosyltransferase family 92 protein RCOM_0530710-like n=1 Tax=Aristolochia californica TaxID=171875 RepID=UPI0035DD6BC6
MALSIDLLLSCYPSEMRRKLPQGAFILLSALIFASFYLFLFRSYHRTRLSSAATLSPSLSQVLVELYPSLSNSRFALLRQEARPRSRVSPPFSVLFPDWEVVVFLDAPLSVDSAGGFFCHFQDGSVSPARPDSIIRDAAENSTFKCSMPPGVRRLRPFFSPLVTGSSEIYSPEAIGGPLPEMSRWSFLAYEALSTEKDVILFVKGVNNRQGRNVPKESLRCVFSNGMIKSFVTSSTQEVFRCSHPPKEKTLPATEKVKISLEVANPDGPPRVVPSTAYYTRPSPRRSALSPSQSLLCACTMIRDAAKFLREWVTYHAAVGVDRFFVYDNGSEDDVGGVIHKLTEDGYQVMRILWAWEKTQEAGFSHCAISYKDSCTWMMFIDVDEFVFSPYWLNASSPSRHMIPSVLPWTTSSLSLSSSPSSRIGQISIPCHEFGPSNQATHPKSGVTQGYTCRRLVEQRHKSIVLLDAVDDSLLNLVHHFQLKEGYRSRKVSKNKWVVNHYKYQAWPEFKKKFRRRVSAYVVDWRSNMNPTSQDRAPGLGFLPVEPDGWKTKFCEVNDTQLMELVERWFSVEGDNGQRIAWLDE